MSDEETDLMICCRLIHDSHMLSFRNPGGRGYTGLVNKAGRWAPDAIPDLLPREVTIPAAKALAAAVSVVFIGYVDMPELEAVL